MRQEGNLSMKITKKNDQHRNHKKGHQKSGVAAGSSSARISLKHHEPSRPNTSILRKKVDPETMKYFTEIADLFNKNEVDMDERVTICANALDETRGKEVELATDMIISHTVQVLLEGCDLDHLCAFVRRCANGFPTIAMDKFGSHVAETALKCLARHDEESSYSYVEETLTNLCQVVVDDINNVMSNSYGSHVLRSLLCLCKGVPLSSLEDVAKRNAVLAERLSDVNAHSIGNDSKNSLRGFPAIFKFLVREMFNHAKVEIKILRANKYSSFVFQTALKLSAGNGEELLHAILTLLGCHENSNEEGKLICSTKKQEIMVLIEETASSHLFEVIVEVSPEILYDELVTEVFKGSIFEIASHHCGNFVVQAVISSARTADQMDVIWIELGTKFKELLELGRPGVVASVLAACKRLQTHTNECCKALTAALSSDPESHSFIVPHMLFLDSYFRDKSSWEWPSGGKMHTLGCLMLQTIFKFPGNQIKPYVTSITSMNASQTFQMVKDAGGARVFEAFISSDVSWKLKTKMIAKLQGQFGELAVIPSSSFTIEKCFTASKISLKETITAELLEVRPELSKLKHGPYLLKKLDVDGFASRPEQWKRSQSAKENAYKEFQTVFGSKGNTQEQNFIARKSSEKSSTRRYERHEKIRENEGEPMENFGREFPGMEISMTKLGFAGRKQGINKGDRRPGNNNFITGNTSTTFMTNSGKRKSSAAELADLAGKSRLSAGDISKLFKSSMKDEHEQYGKQKVPFLKRQKR